MKFYRNINMQDNRVVHLGEPIEDDDAVTKLWSQLLFGAGSPPHVITVDSSAVPVFDVSHPYTCLDITELTEDVTSMSNGMEGTPQNFWRLMVRVFGVSTQRINWGPAFVDSGIARAVTVTQPNKTHEVGFEYNSARDVWTCLAVDPVGY